MTAEPVKLPPWATRNVYGLPVWIWLGLGCAVLALACAGLGAIVTLTTPRTQPPLAITAEQLLDDFSRDDRKHRGRQLSVSGIVHALSYTDDGRVTVTFRHPNEALARSQVLCVLNRNPPPIRRGQFLTVTGTCTGQDGRDVVITSGEAKPLQ